MNTMFGLFISFGALLPTADADADAAIRRADTPAGTSDPARARAVESTPASLYHFSPCCFAHVTNAQFSPIRDAAPNALALSRNA